VLVVEHGPTNVIDAHATIGRTIAAQAARPGGEGMKQFYCGAVIPGCQAKFTGESEQAILVQVAEHAARDHGLKEIPPSVVVQVREHIREAG
jgi:predicted small metal-binding protein